MFRYHPAKASSTLTLEQLNALNQELLLRLQESRRAVIEHHSARHVHAPRGDCETA